MKRRGSRPPKGFDIRPDRPDEATDVAEGRIRDRLDAAKESLAYDSTVRTHVYKDGSVDGELAIKVPRGTSAEDLSFDVEEAIGRTGFGPGYWVSTGARYTIKQDEEVYRKFRGMNQVAVHYQRASRTNVVETQLILRKQILAGLKKKYRRKADTIFVRFHWSPTGERPKS